VKVKSISEINIHSISTLQGSVEMEDLVGVKGNFMNPQSSTTNFNIVQDSLLAMYKMTQGFRKISNSLYSSMIMNMDNVDYSVVVEKIKLVEKIYKKHGVKTNCKYDGKMMFSLLLPNDFNYTKKNNADPDFPIVKIENGVLYEGTINKSNLSGGQGTILFLLYKLYSVEKSIEFLNNVQFFSNEYFKCFGFTVGIEDCLDYTKTEIENVIERGFIESEEIENVIENKYIKEAKINAALVKTSNIGMKIAKEKMGNNNFIDTITSGSKGSLFNIAQITSTLGQQNINGKRFKGVLYGGRSLIHYPFENLNLHDKYESRGFIKSSFINGLNPKEFIFSSAIGRDGVISTSMKTSSSGYCTRKLIKIAEDCIVQHDGTVRDTTNKIIQVNYGYDGFDAKNMINVNGEMQFCNVEKLASILDANTDLKNMI
jgi:DNA-directed RNA polymerase beta' subunit